MNPEENLALARFLARPPRSAPDEASHRGACGRAYYAAFGVARDLLLMAGFRVSAAAEAHTVIVRLLQASGDEEVRLAGKALHKLRIVRNQADYAVGLRAHTARRFGGAESEVAVNSAITIVGELRRVRREDRRLKIPPGTII